MLILGQPQKKFKNPPSRKFLVFQEINLSGLIFFLYFRRELFELKKWKRSTLKNFLIFQEMELSPPKNLINLLYTLNKTPLGVEAQVGCLSNLYYWLAAQVSRFLIHFPFQNTSVGGPLVPYHSLCSTCVTYRSRYHAIGHQMRPAQPFLPRGAEDFPGGDKYPGNVPLLTFLAYLQPVKD